VSGGIGLLTAVVLLGAAAPPQPVCEPVLGPGLKAGAWGVLRVELINTWRSPGRATVMQRGGANARAVLTASELKPGQHGEFFIPFRALDPRAPLYAGIESEALKPGSDWGAPRFDDAVLAAGEPLVVEVRASAGPQLLLPVRMQHGRVHPDRLPDWSAAYEGVDILVFSEVPSGGLAPSKLRALRAWYRSGGTVVVRSTGALLDLSSALLGQPTADPKSRAEWAGLLGGESRVARWRDGRPQLASFGAGFGRGVLALPGAKGGSPRWVGLAQEAYGRRPAAIAPAVRRDLYHRRESFPRLSGSLVGAGRALRRSLIALLLLAALGGLLWRRRRPAIFAAAVALSALAAILVVLWALPQPRVRAMSLRVDEFSPDGMGVRAREYLYLEKAEGNPDVDVLAGPGVLPSPILYAEGEAAALSFRMEPRRTGGGSGFLLADLAFREESLFLGAGPLPDARVLKPGELPQGSRLVRVDHLSKDRAISAMADCMASPGGRLRPQAEFLAEALWSERQFQRALEPGAPQRIAVCRLPAVAPQLEPDGSEVVVTSLKRVGIFYGVRK